MSRLKVFLAISIVLLAQISCRATRLEYVESTPIPVEIQIPDLVKHGQEFEITLTTEPGATCLAVISYWDKSDHWAGKELQSLIADKEGVCAWNWIVPDEAKNGQAEIRGFVEKDDNHTSFIPKAFCIEVCL
jgi:hypothetical protein